MIFGVLAVAGLYLDFTAAVNHNVVGVVVGSSLFAGSVIFSRRKKGV